MRKIIFILLLCTGSVQAQNFRFGPEIGCAFGGKGSEKSVINGRLDHIHLSDTYSKNLLIGLNGQYTYRRCFYVSAGVQYQERGSTFTDDRIAPGITNGISYVSHATETSRFKKICLPVSVGLTGRFGRFQPAVFIGWRPNFIVAGTHHSSNTVDYQDPAMADVYNQRTFNPLDGSKNGFWIISQRFYGFSLLCYDRLRLSFTVNRGKDIFYTDGPLSCFGFSCRNNDYLITAGWTWGRTRAACHFIKAKTVRFL
jgi:hypothetical protein